MSSATAAAIPNDSEDVAAAMAEVSVLPGGGGGRVGGSHRAQPQVVPDLEATDENGELVRQRFLQFLND